MIEVELIMSNILYMFGKEEVNEIEEVFNDIDGSVFKLDLSDFESFINKGLDEPQEFFDNLVSVDTFDVRYLESENKVKFTDNR